MARLATMTNTGSGVMRGRGQPRSQPAALLASSITKAELELGNVEEAALHTRLAVGRLERRAI